jgi:uncharacterized protein involved in exopolysaccharide biosynthesis
MSEQVSTYEKKSEEVSLRDLISNIKELINYLWGYKFLILLVACLSGGGGFIYVKYFTKPIYTANISFTMEQRSNSGGALGGLASSLGLGDIGSGGSSGMFGGENILHLIKSNRIIHQSLKEAQQELEGENLLNLYLKNHFYQSIKEKKIALFPRNLDSVVFSRNQDSLLWSA